METINKTINGIELPHYVNEYWYHDGWGMESRIAHEPIYSSQCKPKKIGEEPRHSNFSVHTPQTYTFYFSVSKAEFEAMKVKPQLTKQVRPFRSHNFDGFTECIQEEKECMGWEELNVINYHTKHRKVFFVED